jgi:hypothetical protein
VKRATRLILGFALALVFGGALLLLREFQAHGARDFTGSCVNNLSMLLVAEQPTAVDSASLQPLLARHEWGAVCSVDGWGNPIALKLEHTGAGTVYYVTSYGSDGQPGPANIYPSSRDDRLDWVMRNGRYVR